MDLDYITANAERQRLNDLQAFRRRLIIEGKCGRIGRESTYPCDKPGRHFGLCNHD